MSDLIKRQDAIDALSRGSGCGNSCRKAIENLPSAEQWNLGNGLENVCNSVMRKLRYASHQLEERERTIINLDSYENTVLIWALNEYMHDGKFVERI